MELTIYLILLVYYIIGAVIIIVINRNVSKHESKKAWLKYFTYIGIITLLYSSIIYNEIVFHYICLAIIILCLFEIVRIALISKKHIIGIITLLVLSISSFSLYHFSLSDQNILLFTFSIVTVFDSASQLSGQLFGKHKILPKISPNKTLEGLIGGFIISIITSYLIRNLLDTNIFHTIIFGLGISLFAFLGDFLASFCKRKFGIKDFSNFLPGQGGFLDRFDSLLMASVLMLLLTQF